MDDFSNYITTLIVTFNVCCRLVFIYCSRCVSRLGTVANCSVLNAAVTRHRSAESTQKKAFAYATPAFCHCRRQAAEQTMW